MAAFFGVVGAYSLLFGNVPRLWAFWVAAAFLLPALILPRALGPLNKVWTQFGLLMSSIVSPVALALLFFGVITPYGWLMRRFGKGQIPMDFDKDAGSYWIVRDPPGPPAQSLRDQF